MELLDLGSKFLLVHFSLVGIVKQLHWDIVDDLKVCKRVH